MTIRYGSIPRKNVADRPAVNGFSNQKIMSRPWISRISRKIAPNRSAPNAARIGLHWAKMTRPMAIQPRPLTVWSPNQPGDTASVIAAPARPASSPPTKTYP